MYSFLSSTLNGFKECLERLIFFLSDAIVLYWNGKAKTLVLLVPYCIHQSCVKVPENIFVYRDMIIRVEGAKHSFQYPVKGDFQLHKRFMKEGKATVSLCEARMNLMISNAPPNQLLVFLRMLASKKAVMGIENGKEEVSARKRLLSMLPKSFEEISPLTFKVSFILLCVV